MLHSLITLFFVTVRNNSNTVTRKCKADEGKSSCRKRSFGNTGKKNILISHKPPSYSNVVNKETVIMQLFL